MLAIRTDLPLLSADNYAALVRAVLDADPSEPETAAIEWKGQWELHSPRHCFQTARHLLGFGNRQPDAAASSFGGHAYLICGAEPGALHGVDVPDPAKISDGVDRYIAPGSPRWSAWPVTVDDRHVVVFAVDPPRFGDRICTLRRSYEGAAAGRIYVRRAGKTEEASPDDVRALEERYAAHAVAIAQDGRLHQRRAADAAEAALEVQRMQAQHDRVDRARRDAPRWVPGRSATGFVLHSPDRFSGVLRNAGASGARIESVRLHYDGGAVPGAVREIFGPGPVPESLVPTAYLRGQGELFVQFVHPALGILAQSGAHGLTLEVWFRDDSDFEWRADIRLLRDGVDVGGLVRWRLGDVEQHLTE